MAEEAVILLMDEPALGGATPLGRHARSRRSRSWFSRSMRHICRAARDAGQLQNALGAREPIRVRNGVGEGQSASRTSLCPECKQRAPAKSRVGNSRGRPARRIAYPRLRGRYADTLARYLRTRLTEPYRISRAVT